MTRRPRRNHTPAFKAKVALAAVKGEKTLADLVEDNREDMTQKKQFDIHPNDHPVEGAASRRAAGLFGSESRSDSQGPGVDLTVLHAKIGELTLENDFLAGQSGFADANNDRPLA